MDKKRGYEENSFINSQKLVTATGVRIRDLCVTQRGNKTYYPPSIPKERSSLTKNVCIFVCIILSTVDFFTNKFDTGAFLVYYGCGFLANFLFHFLYRSILVLEELKHINTRYEGRYETLFKDTFTVSHNIIIAIVLSLFGICIRGTGDIFPITPNNNFIFCFAPSIFLLGKIFDLNASPLNNSLQISQTNGLDYGSGMAYSYYNGYLKLIMQKTGGEDKDLTELMQIYEAEHGVEFEAYKLFILIPVSLRCWVSLKNDFSPTVDESHTIREKQFTVAGVRNRVYKNSVYKITLGTNKKVYVSAEYASPLKTFYDVVSGSGNHAVFYRKHKNEICLQFFLTLKKILIANHYNEICELIFFDDSYVDVDGTTCYHDVGKVLLTRLKEMKKNQREKTE